MSKKILTKLKSGISTDVDTLIKMDITDQEKSKVIKNIQAEYDIYSKQRLDDENVKLLKDKFKLDKFKVEEEIRIQKTKLEIDIEKNDIERAKLDLERDRIEIDKLRINNETLEVESNTKRNKFDKFVNIGMKVMEIGLPLAVNTALVMLNFKLIYADDGRVPSEMKDLMKNVYRAK